MTAPRCGEVSWIFAGSLLLSTVFYDVTVVTAAGDLIRETKTEDTHLRIADDIQLVPGGKYFRFNSRSRSRG